VEKYSRAGQATDDNTCVACQVPEATNTHSEYVILITFPLQQCTVILISPVLLMTSVECIFNFVIF